MFSVDCKAFNQEGEVAHRFERIWMSKAEAEVLMDQILNPKVVVPGQHWDTIVVRGS